jgi:sialidase-1
MKKILIIFFAFIKTVSIYSDPYISELAQIYQNGIVYNNFRIPCLIKAPNGDLLAVAEARAEGDHENVDLVYKRSTNNGDTWGALVEIWGHQWSDGTTFGNPCAVIDEETGRIWLTMCKDQFEVFITYSDDNGITWVDPYDITASVKNPAWNWPESVNTGFGERVIWTGPGVGIQLKYGPKPGRLIIPCHMRPKDMGVNDNRMWVFYSDDHGVNWQYCDSNALGNESQVVELQDGTLMLNGRNQKIMGGAPVHRLLSYSSDAGVTWSNSVLDDELREPVCQASLIRFSYGTGINNRIIFSNPNSDGRDHGTVRISYDDGQTWAFSKEITAGSFAYSSLVKMEHDLVGLLYETGGIAFQKFNLEWLGEAPMGCMDPLAINYDPLAMVACDSCCEYESSIMVRNKASEFLEITPEMVSIRRAGQYSITVVNAKSEMVLSGNGSGIGEYSLAHLEAGIYFIKVTALKDRKVERVLRY